MQHRGEIVEREVRLSGYSISKLAKRLGRSRRWLYNIFDNPLVPIDDILRIGSVIHVNFNPLIDELAHKAHFQEDMKDYKTMKEELDMWRNKYYQLLEEHNQLLKEKGSKEE